MQIPFVSLAPFQGITNKEFRNLFAKYFPGYDAFYAPFISGVHPEKVNPSKFRDVIPALNSIVKTIPQFVSTDANEIIAICKFLAHKGFDEINWNMGCPFPRLANKMRGCGILPFPEEIRKLLDQVVPAISIRLSVKCRLGYHSPDELKMVSRVFNDYPLHEIIVHPRIGKQLYKGDVNLPKFSEFLRLNKHRLAYNGDIYHYQRYLQLKNIYPGIDHWMVGRGALINPFLAMEIKETRLDEESKRAAVAGFHSDLMEASQNLADHKRTLLGSMKSVWYYMSGMFENGKQFFQKIKVCEDIGSYNSIVNALIDEPFAQYVDIENHFRKGLKHI
jgi:tRNA-dihydrouridine synthase B